MINKLELAKEYVEKHPDLSKKKIGEMLHANFPDLFHSNEYGRSAVRAVTGAHGDTLRRNVKARTDLWTGPLPPPSEYDSSKYVLTGERVGILADLQLPFHDEVALSAAIQYLIDYKPDTIVLNGDIADCYHLSKFAIDPRERNTVEEIETVRQFVAMLQMTFEGAKIVYKLGNHEERLERYVYQSAPALAGLECTEFGAVMDLGEEVAIIKDKRIITAGRLNIIHGHEFGQGIFNPVNPARGFFIKAYTNVIGGHYHQTSEHISRDLSRDQKGAWSTGCLCGLNPKYRPINNWNHGFATVDVDSTGDFQVRNLKIINGKIR